VYSVCRRAGKVGTYKIKGIATIAAGFTSKFKDRITDQKKGSSLYIFIHYVCPLLETTMNMVLSVGAWVDYCT
jgi:hypothetical protein